MAKAKANNIEIEYDTFGSPSSKPLLLIMGLGSQMIMWLEEFCNALVNEGFFVIRFDNRDVGLSTKFDEAGVQDLMKVINTAQQGKSINAPYTLNDMADDAIGLLDFLKINKAHICGASMGGMIAQTIAIRHPSRVLSLTSIMSSTGNPDLPQPTPEAMQALLIPAPKEKNAYIKHIVKMGKILYGSGFPYDEKLRSELAGIAYDRCFYPAGFNRQMVAILASGSRKDALKSINVTSLVVHGADDPLVPLEGGKDTAESIPNAKLLIIDGMGHSLPPETWPQIINAISKNAEKV
jgi:pimeloyl-ACP methyl ester carboxylesterase